jgi:uncharacterized protein
MSVSLATLLLGFVIGYLGQRSRLCFISGYRDILLTGDRSSLMGPVGCFVGAVVGFAAVSLLGGNVPGFPMIRHMNIPMMISDAALPFLCAVGIGVLGYMVGGCPFRMHVLAAEGRRTYWYYLAGFYIGLLFFNVVTTRIVEWFTS